jgi:predicted ATP-binding protein involved in virulence
MKILELYLKNFRCFDEETFEFSENFNVLIDDNATGKTVILDALAIAVSSFFLEIDGIFAQNISKDDIRHIAKIRGETPTIESILPVKVSCRALLEEGMEGMTGTNAEKTRWSRVRKKVRGKTTSEYDIGLSIYVDQLQKAVKSERELLDTYGKLIEWQSIPLPVICYYRTGRLWTQKKTSTTNTIQPGSRFRGYENYINGSYKIETLIEWFRTWELASLQQGKVFNTLVGVKNAITTGMIDWKELSYDVLSGELLITSNNKQTLPLRMLSDGVRNLIGIIADIAIRCATLNPQFEAEAARLTPGIVLIDEIDLHLHPRWQRRIVEDLQRTFPNIQFFATTHSPFIIQSLRQGKLINLNDTPYSEYEGQSIEDIAEYLMGIELPQYSQRKLSMLKAAEEYYKVLQEAESCVQNDPIRLEKLKERLDELSLPFSDNPAYHAFLKMERLAKGV